MRVWNNPYDANKNGYGGGTNDIDKAVLIGKRATDAGFGVLLDFHYSDFCSDSSKQSAPKAWQDYSLEQKENAITDFTTDSLTRLRDGGVKVTMVHFGNEINNGMCGERNDDGVFPLVKAGSDAVRGFDKNIQIVVHYTDPLTNGYLERKSSLLDQYQVDYDVLGTSYYPFWHGDAKELTAVLEAVSTAHEKKVIVAETSYPFTDEDGDGYANVASSKASDQTYIYPITVEGQAVAVRDVVEAVSNVKNGIGVFYWESAWIPVHHYNSAAPDAKDTLQKNSDAWEKYGSGWASSYAAGK